MQPEILWLLLDTESCKYISYYLLSIQETILSETMNHYKTLYSEKQVEDVCLNEEIFETFAIKKLSNTEQQQVEGNLTYEEMLNSLKK